MHIIIAVMRCCIFQNCEIGEYIDDYKLTSLIFLIVVLVQAMPNISGPYSQGNSYKSSNSVLQNYSYMAINIVVVRKLTMMV